MLFGTVTQDTFEKILDAMFIKKIAKGENVIQQGDEGDYFYIVKKGDFDIFVKKGDDPPKTLSEIVWMQNPPLCNHKSRTLLYTVPKFHLYFPLSSSHLNLHHPFTISSLHRKKNSISYPRFHPV